MLKKKIFCFVMTKNLLLELRQFKNDSIKSKIIPILRLPRFFTTEGKRVAISKLKLFLTRWNLSYIVFALIALV